METIATQKLTSDTVKVRVNDRYHIIFAPEPYLILGVGLVGRDFNHPSIVAKKTDVLEFKHYRDNGSKFWTSKAGVEHYFVVPKENIEVSLEEGNSYVRTIIGGEKVILNVSGGTHNGWEDWVSRTPHTLVNLSTKTLKAIAANSLTPTECAERGITFDIREERNGSRYIELTVAPIVRKWLKQNKGKLVLQSGWNNGELGPFEIEEHCMRKQGYVALLHNGYITRTIVLYKAIDWTSTAKANNIPLPEACAWNKIGNVLPDAQ